MKSGEMSYRYDKNGSTNSQDLCVYTEASAQRHRRKKVTPDSLFIVCVVLRSYGKKTLQRRMRVVICIWHCNFWHGPSRVVYISIRFLYDYGRSVWVTFPYLRCDEMVKQILRTDLPCQLMADAKVSLVVAYEPLPSTLQSPAPASQRYPHLGGHCP